MRVFELLVLVREVPLPIVLTLAITRVFNEAAEVPETHEQ
jgi:hypothetical protein